MADVESHQMRVDYSQQFCDILVDPSFMTSDFADYLNYKEEIATWEVLLDDLPQLADWRDWSRAPLGKSNA